MDDMTDNLTLKICAEPCDACPWKGRFDLNSGRLKDLMELTAKDDAPFSCHKTVDYGDDENGTDVVFGPASVCAGWLEAADKAGTTATIVKVARVKGWITFT